MANCRVTVHGSFPREVAGFTTAGVHSLEESLGSGPLGCTDILMIRVSATLEDSDHNAEINQAS